MRYFGVGSKITREIYKLPETYWILTRVELSKDQDHGNVYGRMVWRGVAKDKDDKIGSTLQKEWKLLETPDYSIFKGEEDQIKKIIETSAKPYNHENLTKSI